MINLGKQLETAKVTRKSNRISDGNYTLQVVGASYFEGQKGPTFVVDFKVVSSTNTDVATDMLNAGEAPPKALAPDTLCSYVLVNAGSAAAKSATLSNLRGLLAGLDPETADMGGDDLQKVLVQVFEKNAAAGSNIGCNTYRTRTRDGRVFVGYNWTPRE